VQRQLTQIPDESFQEVRL